MSIGTALGLGHPPQTPAIRFGLPRRPPCRPRSAAYNSSVIALWFVLVFVAAVALRLAIRARWRPWRIERRLAEPLATIERVSADALLEMQALDPRGAVPVDGARFFASPFDPRCRAALELPRGDVEALGLDVLRAHHALLDGMDAWDRMSGREHDRRALLPAMREVYLTCRSLGGSLTPALLGEARRGARSRPLIGIVAEVPPPDVAVH